jgi:hypothetical protein
MYDKADRVLRVEIIVNNSIGWGLSAKRGRPPKNLHLRDVPYQNHQGEMLAQNLKLAD